MGHRTDFVFQFRGEYRIWAGGADASAKGKPLHCLLCNGSLLLNAVAFRQHVRSQKHAKALEKHRGYHGAPRDQNPPLRDDARSDCIDGEDSLVDMQSSIEMDGMFCFAKSKRKKAEEEEEGETHFERLMRIEATAKAVKAVKAARNTRVQSTGQKPADKRKALASRRGKRAKSRPGKRQRQAIKDASQEATKAKGDGVKGAPSKASVNGAKPEKKRSKSKNPG